MFGIDTYSGWFALIGGIFVAWFILVALFAPHIPYKMQTPLDCASLDFIYSLRNATLASVHHDSRFEVLTNADEFYPAMLEAIAGAQRSVHMECYIFGVGAIGRRFIDALMERARAGVEVALTVDAIGSLNFRRSAIAEMTSAGCRVEQYQPFQWHRLARMNNRTHRELLVVDGAVAFIGGAGIGDQWTIGEHGKRPWRDTMARVTGPVVSSLQGVFAENWLECSGEILTGPRSFPELQKTGSTSSMVIKSAPGDRATPSRVVFQMLIESATRSIRITTPYFLPDRALRQAFLRSARRGVKIEIVVPGSHTDQRWVRLVSRRNYIGLLKEGIRIFEYRAGMTHAKVLNVDDLWVVLGTTNFDNRSFEHNDELNVAIRDEGLSARLTHDFCTDLTRCEEMTIEKWKSRPWLERLVDPFSWILERQQ